MLARPDGPGQREIVCDLDGGIANFWRAVTAEPDLVAAWADYPTLHADLTARHKWLRAWFTEHTAELSNDPHFYCAKVAGWWVWGISLWIGGGWCNASSNGKTPDQRPMAPGGAFGNGVSAQTVSAQRVWDVRPAVTSGNPLAESVDTTGVSAQAQRAQGGQIPKVLEHPGGSGVSAQGTRAQKVLDKIPHVAAGGWSIGGGQGVSAQRKNLPQVLDKIPKVDPKGGGQRVSAQSKQAQGTRATQDKIPYVQHWPGGQGVSAQHTNLPFVKDKIPLTSDHPGGKGVSAQSSRATPDQRPYVDGKGPGGQGVSAQRLAVPDQIPRGVGNGVASHRVTRPDLVSWFRAIQERLKGVIVLNRGWESALTPTLLMHTPTSPKPPVGILLDPPYLTTDRQSELYGSDADGSSSDVATAAYAWALENGDRFRIAYCCHEGDFPVPEGWTFITASFGGVKDVERRASRQDMVMFSPLCVPDEPDPQMSMFDLLEE